MITEIGGTVGDIESQPFLEAIRQFSLDVGKRELPVHPPDAGALSEGGRRAEDQAHAALGRPVAQIGIQPDMLICRTERSHQPRRSRKDRPVLQRADRGRDRREGQGLFDLRSAAEPGRQQARRADRRQAWACRPASSTWTTGATCCIDLRNPEHEISDRRGRQVRRASRRLQVDLRSARPRRHRQSGADPHPAHPERSDRTAKGPSGCWPATTACWCPAASASAASRARSRRSASPASARFRSSASAWACSAR